MRKEYRVEWMHNYNWRMDVNDGGTFFTEEEARAYEDSIHEKSPKLKTRIVEVR